MWKSVGGPKGRSLRNRIPDPRPSVPRPCRDQCGSGLKNLVVLVTAVAYFVAAFLGRQMKLRILCEKLLIVPQRFFGIPPFRFYALADGIRKIPSQTTVSPPVPPPASLQLELALRWEA